MFLFTASPKEIVLYWKKHSQEIEVGEQRFCKKRENGNHSVGNDAARNETEQIAQSLDQSINQRSKRKENDPDSPFPLRLSGARKSSHKKRAGHGDKQFSISGLLKVKK